MSTRPEDYEKQARSLLLHSNMSSGCTASLGLFGLSVVILSASLLFMMLMILTQQDMIPMFILGGICLFFILTGGLISWLSFSSFKANRLKAKESKRYIENYRERKAAQHGSISMAAMSGEGGLNMIGDEGESPSQVALDFDTRHEEEVVEYAEVETMKK